MTLAPPRLTGIGVGPGDPELLTMQAAKRLRAADVVVAPTLDLDVEGRAEHVVRQALGDLAVSRLLFDMTPDREPGGRTRRHQSHLGVAKQLAGWLGPGREVAFVTLGDPNVYSTFPTVAASVASIVPDLVVDTVPGICAFQALAALSGTVLLDGTQSLELVTALDGVDHLADALRHPDRAVVVYKGGRYLDEIRDVLSGHGRLEGAVLGELLGMAGQRVVPLAGATAPVSYLAAVIVPPLDQP